MRFDEDDDGQTIRLAVRRVCASFDDNYWAERDRDRCGVHRGRGGGDQWSLHERGERHPPVDVRDASGGRARLRRPPLKDPAGGGAGQDARGLRRHRTRRRAGHTSITTRAMLEGDHYRVDGRKIWTSKALESDKVLFAGADHAQVRGSQIHRRDDLVGGQPERPGGHRHPHRQDGSQCGGIVRRGLRRSARSWWHPRPWGWGAPPCAEPWPTPSNGEVFGRPIGANQGISFPLAEAHIRLNAVAWLSPRTPGASTRACSAASRSRRQAPGGRRRVQGGRYRRADPRRLGYAQEYHVERYFREARLPRIAPVSQEMVLNYVAEHVLGLPRSS